MFYCYNRTWLHSDLKLDQMIVDSRVCVRMRIVVGVGFDREGQRFNNIRIDRWHIEDFEHSVACLVNCDIARL